MEIGPHRRIAVTERSAVAELRQVVTAVAHDAGLTEEYQHRAALVATELGTNLVKHAHAGGEVLVAERNGPGGIDIELVSIDRGPGMDVNASLVDGVSSAGSPGTGLGAARRLSNVFDAYSTSRGTVVLARVGAGTQTARRRDAFMVGGVSVPFAGETVSGDAWAIHQDNDVLTAVVIDGLGHGLGAHDAALALMAEPLDDGRTPAAILERMHRRAAHTRGAAGAAAQVRRGAPTMTFAGVGNVAGALLTATARRQTVSANGTLGHHTPAFREFTYPWTHDTLLVVHTDGLLSQWSIEEGYRLRQCHPSVVAAVLYRDFSRQRDDVTVVVMKETS